MCGRKSKSGVRSSGSGFAPRLAFVLFLLFAASPLWAADWAFLRGQSQDALVQMASENQQAQVQEAVGQASIQPVSQELISQPSTASTESSVSRLPELLTQLTELEAQSKKSLLVTDSLRTDLTDLKTRLEAYEQAEIAEDEIHQQTINALSVSEETNIKQADEIVSLSEALKSERKSKGYVKLSGLFGLDEDKTPEYGAGLSIGMRVGRHMILELGIQTMIGSIKTPIYGFSLRNLVGVVSIGWEF